MILSPSGSSKLVDLSLEAFVRPRLLSSNSFTQEKTNSKTLKNFKDIDIENDLREIQEDLGDLF